jgi:hypothetical protein
MNQTIKKYQRPSSKGRIKVIIIKKIGTEGDVIPLLIRIKFNDALK